MRAPRASRRSSSAAASSTSSSESSGTPKIRPSAPKPQSSSSQRLNAVIAAKLASASPRIACSTGDGEGREQQDRLDPLLVHHREARVAVLVFAAHRLQERRRGALALRAHHLLEMTRRRDELERGRREMVLLPGDEDLIAARGVADDVHGAIAEARIQMAAERVARLVVVVVGVENPE
jgi:hypothetical protein